MKDRIFCEWTNGSFISTAHPKFQEVFEKLVAMYGKPKLAEFRPKTPALFGGV